MGLESIGKHISEFRHLRKLRQEDLAEITGLSTNYIGAVERGEKIPSLETFIDILNALSVSADVVLSDVLQEGYQVKATKLSDQIKDLPVKDQKRIFDVIETLNSFRVWASTPLAASMTMTAESAAIRVR